MSSLRGRITVADGDVRGELWAHGWSRTRAIEYVSVEQKDLLRSVVDSFLDSGSEIIVTPTAGANGLVYQGSEKAPDATEERLREINKNAAEVCVTAVEEYPAKNRFVLGALGPTPQLLMLEEVTEDELAAAYHTQAVALLEGGVHGFVFSGFCELEALVAAVRSVRRIGDFPVIGCMCFDAGAEGTETTLGVTAPQAAASLLEAGVGAVGCDSVDNVESAISIYSLFRSACDLPILVRISSGEGQVVEGRLEHAGTPLEFAERCGGFMGDVGSIIGGGWGVGHEHIAALVAKREKGGAKRT